MIKIEVCDPMSHDPSELRALANFFLACAGEPVKSVGVIAAEDNPAVGQDVPSPPSVSSLPDPASVFGGKVDGAPFTAGVNPSSIAPVATRVTLPASTASPTIAPPPAPPVAIAAPPAPPAPPAPGVEVDAKGMPWDGRIHAETRAKNKDSTWRYRRNVADDMITSVEAELRSVMAIPNPLAQFKTAGELGITAPPPPPPPTVPPVPPAGTVGAFSPTNVPLVPAALQIAVVTPPAAPANVPNVPPPPPVPTSLPVSQAVSGGVSGTTAQPVTFPQLVPKVTLGMANKTLSEARVTEILTHYGLPSLPALIHRPELVQPVHDALFAS